MLIGAIGLGAICGAVGSLAVLRHQALVADVVAHGSLMGVAGIFLLFQVKSSAVLLFGAMVSAVLVLLFLRWVRRRSRTKEDTTLAIALSVSFGVGITLSRLVQNVVPSASKAGLDSFLFGKASGIILQDVAAIYALVLFTFAALFLLFSRLKVSVFDPAFGSLLGIPTGRLNFFVATLAAVVVIAGLPMVGVVLISALMILPAVSARFWSITLSGGLWISAGIGAVSAGLGVWISSIESGLPTGPIIVLVAAAIFVVSALASPREGLIATGLARATMRRSSLESEMLACAERGLTVAEAKRIVGARFDSLFDSLSRDGRIERRGDLLLVVQGDTP